jgi:sugar O-acyltransferase (sialic acid O-acetyltransferase NeuD family)
MQEHALSAVQKQAVMDMPARRSLLVLGTRPFSLEIADVASEVPGYDVVGFVENIEKTKCQQKLEGYPIYWIDQTADLACSHWAVNGLGTTHRSRFVEQALACGMSFATLVHPTARVSTKSQLGTGSFVSVGSIIAAYTTLGEHVLVNRGVIIGHHTTIGDYVSIMMGARVAGDTRIGKASYIGLGAVIRNGVTIGSHCVIGAGAVVTKDIPDNTMAYGNPARIVKENIDGM